MTQELAIHQPKKKALSVLASRLQIEETKLLDTLKKTVFKDARNDEELAALVVVANTYELNPLLRELYAYPAKGGGIVPVVSVDGWINLCNSHPQYDGMEFDFKEDKEGNPVSCTCAIFRKDRKHATKVTEYFSECYRNTEPWKMKHRMLRHKALIQCARVAFGFSGIYDEDDAAAIAGRVESVASQPARPIFKTAELEDKKEAVLETIPDEPKKPDPVEIIAETVVIAPPEPQKDLLGEPIKEETPQEKVTRELRAAGYSEAEFFTALKTLHIKTPSATVKGLTDQLAEGALKDWDTMLETLASLPN